MPKKKRRQRKRRATKERPSGARSPRDRQAPSATDLAAAQEELFTVLLPGVDDAVISPEEVVDRFLGCLGDRSIHCSIGAYIVTKAGDDRAQAIERAASLRDEPLAKEFAGWIAFALERPRDGIALVSQAIEHHEPTDDDPIRRGTRIALALNITATRPGMAVDVLIPAASADPEDPVVQSLLAVVLERIWWRGVHVLPDDPCPCGIGSSTTYAACCEGEDAHGVGHFLDDTRYRALISEAAARFESEPIVQHLASEAWAARFGADLEDLRDVALGNALMVQWAAGTLSPAGAENDDPHDCILGAMANDETLAPELRFDALQAVDLGRYGLWQVQSPFAEPGYHVRDIVTGERHYVAVLMEDDPGDDRGGNLETEVAPWTTFLGELVPVGGIWWLGPHVRLGPSAAEELATDILHLATVLVPEFLSPEATPRGRSRVTQLQRTYRARAKRVVSLEPEMDEIAAFILTRVMGGAFPQILDAAHPVLPQLANTEGHPLILHEATVVLGEGDADAVIAVLAAGPDFEDDVDEGERVVHWLGDDVPPAQRKAAMAQLHAAGAEPVEEDSPRTLCGVIRVIDTETMAVSVNSDERLAELLDHLRAAGAEPRVTDDRIIDPRLDLPMPGVATRLTPPPSPGASADVYRAAWAESWIDENIPALKGLTPRAAAKGPQRPRLELLLRQFEFMGSHRRDGASREDPIAKMRVELGMTDSR